MKKHILKYVKIDYIGNIMPAEESKIQIIDLCARIPYHPMCRVTFGNKVTVKELEATDLFSPLSKSDKKYEVKLFLRPLSSMTVEERAEYKKVAPGIVAEDGVSIPNIPKTDWLYAHHFDFRGFIPKDLALTASEDMYNK